MRCVLLMVLSIFTFSAASAESHCAANETVLVNGVFGKVSNDKFTGSKILSLCADKQKEPFGTLDYRFGSIGKIEMSFSAPKDGAFYKTQQQPMPRAIVNAVYFKKGTFTYAITECHGMHCSNDIYLWVFNNKKQIARLQCDPKQCLIDMDGIDFDSEKPKNALLLKKSEIEFDPNQ